MILLFISFIQKYTVPKTKVLYMFILWILWFIGISCETLLHIPLKLSRASVSEEVLIKGSNYIIQGENLRGKPGQGYYIEVGIGTPFQLLNVLVDTGSSNFAVAASENSLITTHFQKNNSSTFKDQHINVHVPYTQGNWKGMLGSDNICLLSLPNITVRSNVALISSSEKFFINGSNWQGILGLAYGTIARPDSSVEPFFDTLVWQANVSNVFSLQLCGPIDQQNQTNISMGGNMIIGGIDSHLFIGPIIYTPLHKEWYYEVIIAEISVNGRKLPLDCSELNFDKSIVDSGTTNLRLPTKVFNLIIAFINESSELDKTIPDTFWQGDQIMCWNTGVVPWGSFPTIEIKLAHTYNSTFQLTVSPQQYLRAVSDLDDSSNQKDCYKFAVTSSEMGTVLGAVVMEGFYVIFDRQNRRIGFAKSTCSSRDPSTDSTQVSGAIFSEENPFLCVYESSDNNGRGLYIVAYVMAAICALCMVPLMIMMIQWQCSHRHQEDVSSLLND